MKEKIREIGLLATLVCVIGVMVFTATNVINDEVNSKCQRNGCHNYKTKESNYCWTHSNLLSNYVQNNYSSEGANATKKSNTSGNTSSSSKSNGWNEYDLGYDDVYFDEDYDRDRYWSDSEYADGVDDAIDDSEW